MADKKNLVIVRAGDESLHESWLEGERNWDMIVSCFGEHPEKWRRDDVINIFYKGGKYDGIYDAFQQLPDLLDKYDYITMADDDFAMTADDLNKIFDLTRKYGLQLAQPSMSFESYIHSYFALYHNPLFTVRLTNFVEEATTCMASVFLRRILPLWKDSPLAYGVDYFWTRLTDNPAKQAGIIDQVQVMHTRPPGSGGLKYFLEENDKQVDYEIQGIKKSDIKIMGKSKKSSIEINCHGGWLKGGIRIKGRWMILPFLLLGRLISLKKFNPNKCFHTESTIGKKIKWEMQHQIFSKMDLSRAQLIIHKPEE